MDYVRKESTESEKLLHTPAGVRDIYGAECEQKISLTDRVHKVLKSHAFFDIQTPTFEYFDIFGRERGSVQSKEMFKFFDRENNTLALRPDVTPAIARCVAKYYRNETLPVRLCYTGNTFVNLSLYKGKLQEVTQVGAELFNDDTSDADAEMIAVMAECLRASGLQQFQLEIGHADLFAGLAAEAGIDREQTATLRDLIVQKNFFGAANFLEELTVPAPIREIFIQLPELLNNLKESAEFIRARTKSKRVEKALDRLEKVENILSAYGFSPYVTTDLSMISRHDYYTGIIFRAYTYGNGEALAAGGRYDGLVGQFGKDAPAIGFAIVVDGLLAALQKQDKEKVFMGHTILLYPTALRAEAIKMAQEMRNEGKKVQLLRRSSRKEQKDYTDYAKRTSAECLLALEKSRDKVTVKQIAL